MATQSLSNNDIVARITCRISTPRGGKGTAVLINPGQDDLLYILTAKHILLGKSFDQDIKNSEVEISVPDQQEEKFDTFRLKDIDEILFPTEKHIDAAILILRGQRNMKVPHVALLNTRAVSRECFFRGYPQAYRHLEGVTIGQVTYTENNIVTTKTSLATLSSDPLYNVEGFSGSGVFCEVGEQLYLIGIIYAFREAFTRFSVCDLSFLNDLLSSRDLPDLQFTNLPLNESISKDIQRLVSRSTLVLDGIMDKFGGYFVLERKRIDSDFEAKWTDNRLIIFKGVAGVGKSASVKLIVSRLQSDYFVLAFKADMFAKASVEEVFSSYINNSLDNILDQLGQERQVIIFIDSLEKLLEVDTNEALKEFLRICKRFSGVKIIVTCRSSIYQRLVLELRNDFPQKYDFVDVPLLNDEELTKVTTQFSSPSRLLEKKNIKEILRRPFYLNLVILHSETFGSHEFVSEQEFRRLVWDEVISKHDLERSIIFETIALRRAVAMSLYVRIESLNPATINDLHNDGIILIDESLGDSYSPAHDIYEDIALIRFIERIFQERQTAFDFFERLGGKEPAKRRAFRLWLNDQLIEARTSLTTFIITILDEMGIEQYWKDEVIVALLQSEHCQNFLDSNEDLLKRDDNALLLRSIHLLRTTCQEPDEQLVQSLQDNSQGNLYQWMYLKPVGPGWQAILDYIRKHLDDLRIHWALILEMVAQDWSRKIGSNTQLPSEGSAAGKILLGILEDARNDYSPRNKQSYPTKAIDEAIKTLFNLCSIFRDEVKSLIEAADAYSAESSKNYHLRDFHKSVIVLALSGVDSKDLCKELPDLLCRLALKEWLLPISEDGFRNFLADYNIGHGFGLTANVGFHDFPAGIYKTPIRFLLYFHPVKALQLIVTVLNHATEAYAKSERGKQSNVIEVRINRDDGSFTTQLGNPVLWGMYRGTIEATPYLLQSILMSLESWLLDRCQIDEDWAFKWIEFAFNYLLEASHTVATTAVLASVALAYPKRIGRLCFPILKVKEFYGWDYARCRFESSSLEPPDNDIPFAQQERYKSNQLPHRKFYLEGLVTKLQVEGNWDEINEILDEFQRTAERGDTHWQIALRKMDFRTYEIDESIQPPEKGAIVVKPKLEGDLAKIVDESKNSLDLLNKATNVKNWAMGIYEDKPDIERTPEKWREVYRHYLDIVDTDDETLQLFGDPRPLAAIGIRVFRPHLTKEELDWCSDTILHVLEEQIINSINDGLFDPTMFLEQMIQTIPLLLTMELDDKKRREVKEDIFRLLLHSTRHEMEYPFESIRNQLWSIDRAFADSCLAGMIEYAKLHKQRWNAANYGKEAQQRLREFYELEAQLVTRVCDDNIAIHIEDLSFDKYSHWFLGFAVQTIPLDTLNEVHRNFIEQVFQLLFQTLNVAERKIGQDKTEYFTTREQLEQYLAKFLLRQPVLYSQGLFSNILDSVFLVRNKRIDHTAYDFVEGIAEKIIIEEDKLKSGSFWLLWETLESKIRISPKEDFVAYLFLSIPRWTSYAEDWVPLQGKRLYLKKLILELGHHDIKSVVKLLSGIGAAQLLPDGAIWLRQILLHTSSIAQELSESNTLFYCEKLIQRIYYKYLKEIKTNSELRQSLLYLLDNMLNAGSSLAFIIRERVIAI